MSGRVVVAGPYPTMPGPEAAATFALVRRLVDDGEDVTVVSPAPSAAHHYADPGGPRGALRLARLAAGADRLWVRLDAAALAASGDSPRLLPGRLGINIALRRANSATVRLDRVPDSVHPRFVTLVLGPAAEVKVSTESERAALVAAGLATSRVVVESEPPATMASRVAPPVRVADTSSSSTAAELQDLVRQRAALVRTANRRTAVPAEGTASLPLRHLVRMERAKVRSSKPGGAFAKRVIAKALAWQFDNVIQHVNQLHQATIDAMDNLESVGQVEGDTKA